MLKLKDKLTVQLGVVLDSGSVCVCKDGVITGW